MDLAGRLHYPGSACLAIIQTGDVYALSEGIRTVCRASDSMSSQPASAPAPFSRSASVINAAESPPPGCLAVYHQPDGLTIEQAAHVLDIATSTAQNDWAYARYWLRLEIEKSRQDAPS